MMPTAQKSPATSFAHLWMGRLRAWWDGSHWIVLGLAWLVALSLGVIGFAQYKALHEQPASVLDLLYLTLQLVVLESGALEPPLPPLLQAARWILPGLTFYAAAVALAGLFQEQIQAFQLRALRDHTVICGGGRKGLLLARGFRAQGLSVVVIELQESARSLALLRESGAYVLVGDGRTPGLLAQAGVARARNLIAVCGDDATNAEVALRARDLVEGRAGPALTAIVHIVDPQLCELLRERELDPAASPHFRLELFNVFERGARLMLAELPLLSGDENVPLHPPHLLLVGLGRQGESLALYAAQAWRERLSGAPNAHLGRLCLSVVDTQASNRCEALQLRYPKFASVCEMLPYDLDVRSPGFQRGDFLSGGSSPCPPDAVYVCLDNDSLGLQTALALKEHLRQFHSGGSHVPVFVRLAEEGGLANLLSRAPTPNKSNGGLVAFGLLDRTCTPQLVVGGTHETLARAVHAEYIRQQTALGETLDSNPSIVPWDVLPEEKRESNRRQVDHIGAKLRSEGYGIAPLTDWDAPDFQFTPDELERMARLEHDRWVAEHRAQGWTFSPGPKDPQSRTHPSLVDWDALPEAEKEKDRNPVRNLPRFLAKVGMQVYKY